MIRFTVPGAPVSTNQGYKPVKRGRAGMHLALTSEGEGFKARLLLCARRAWMAAGRPAALEQAQVRIRFVFRTMGSDVDGPVKFVLDCLAPAGLVVNDNRVRRVEVEKMGADGDPRTEVEVGAFP